MQNPINIMNACNFGHFQTLLWMDAVCKHFFSLFFMYLNNKQIPVTLCFWFYAICQNCQFFLWFTWDFITWYTAPTKKFDFDFAFCPTQIMGFCNFHFFWFPQSILQSPISGDFEKPISANYVREADFLPTSESQF